MTMIKDILEDWPPGSWISSDGYPATSFSNATLIAVERRGDEIGLTITVDGKNQDTTLFLDDSATCEKIYKGLRSAKGNDFLTAGNVDV